MFIDERPQISSFSDDKSVKIWDIPTEKNIITYTQHSDYIRAGATSPITPDVVLSGGYDNIVHMYDTRTEQGVLSVDHGSPIESLLFLPSGGIFLSAGGTDIKIWDSIAGGRLLGSVSQHHKTITCLKLASNNKRLLSSSLDRHVKIYDIGSFKVVHTLDYPNAILSLGVSKTDDVVAGLVDGLVVVNRRQVEEKVEKKISFKYTTNTHKADLIVNENEKEKETKYDKCLRKFEFSKALDMVLVNYVANKTPQVTVTLIQELMRRKALEKALLGRDVKFITQFLRFFIRNIADYRFTKILINAAHIFINVYEDSVIITSPEVRSLFLKLVQLLKVEIELGHELASLQGTLHMLLSAASASERTFSSIDNLTPSVDAQKTLVYNIN